MRTWLRSTATAELLEISLAACGWTTRGRHRVMDAPRLRPRLPLCVLTTMLVVIGTAPFVPGLRVQAQVPAVKFDVPGTKGRLVSPTYEGWYRLDGKTYVLFGYYNRNREEIVDVPIGPGNQVAPGPIDQGQPTRFFPGQHYGVFAVAVPADRPKTEVTWTLTTHGQTLSIPANLDSLYLVSPQKEDAGPYPGNTPPVVKFEPAGPAAQGPLGMTVNRTAIVSRPLEIDVWVTDDGLPPPPGREGPAPALRGSVAGRPPERRGMDVSWSVYRAPGKVSISNPTPPVEQGKARTMVTFAEPGDYMLHFLAVDSRSGTKCCWTNGYVRVTVTGRAGDR